MLSTPKPQVAASVLMGPPPLPATRQIIYSHPSASSVPVPDLLLLDNRNDNKRKIFLSPRVRTASPSGQDGHYSMSQVVKGGDLANNDKRQGTVVHNRRPSPRLKQKGCFASDLASSLKSSATSATSMMTNSSFTSASLSSSQKSITEEVNSTKETWLDGASMRTILVGFDSDEESDSTSDSIVTELLKYQVLDD